MPTENTIDQECVSADSVSITSTESVGNFENAENRESLMTNITEEIAVDYVKLKGLLKFSERQLTSSLIHKHQMEMMERLDIHLDKHFNEITNSKDPKLDDVVVLAESFICMCHIKCPAIVEPEDSYIAEFFLTRSIILLKDKELNNKTILISMRAISQLGFIYNIRKDPKKSSQYLNKALGLYFAYTNGLDKFSAPINVETIIGIQNELDTVFLLDTMYLSSLSTLIKLDNDCKYELINMEKLSTDMHKLLKRFLIVYKPLSMNYIGWIFEAIQLATYFLTCHRLIECKNHLCAASVMMMRCQNKVYMIIDEETPVREKDIVHKRFKVMVSIIDMIWVKYGLVILYLSRKRLLQNEQENNPCEANKSKTESNKNKLLFKVTNKNFRKFTYTMPDDYITNYDDAKTLFVRILQLLNNLRTDKFASMSVEFRAEIAHYTSRAYKYLAFYEHDKVKQIKLQKRRIDVLKDCLNILLAKDNLNNCIFLWFELGVIYSTLINIKLEDLGISQLTAKDLVEINLLVQNSVHYFQLYWDTSKQQVHVEVERNYPIMFHFNLGYNKTQIYANLYNKYTV